MAREGTGTPPEAVISIIGPGMKVIGDCVTDGTIRVEGTIEGSVRAGKAVVVGKQGSVTGDVVTQDAVISGRVKGTLVAESRLELQASCHIEGEVRTRRMQLEEGAVLNGNVQMGERAALAPSAPGGERDGAAGAERGRHAAVAAPSKG
jgi:cytoskeletal protein CcmA (bactofilin family)